MALRKAVCPHCVNTKKLRDSVFMINPELKTCFCPHCGKKISPINAVESLDKEILKRLQKADYCLFVKCDAEKSYKEYGDILTVDSEQIGARYGRILSLIYSSTMHKSYIDNAIEIFQSENVKYYHKAKDRSFYLRFLVRCNLACNAFVDNMRKKLTLKKCFYDEECLKVYYQHLHEIIEFKKIIFDEAKMLSKKYDVAKLDGFIASISEDIIAKENLLESSERLANGTLFKLNKIKRNGEITLTKCEGIIDTKLSKYRLATFDCTNKDLRHISEIVFNNYTYRIVLANLSLVCLIAFYVCGIILGTLAFVTNKNTANFYIYSVVGSISLLFGVASTVLFIVFIRLIKKRKFKLN